MEHGTIWLILSFTFTTMKFSSPQKLSELATLTSSRIIGDEQKLVHGINEIHKVEEGDITFVDHPKYYDKALQSAATFIIINKEVTVPGGKALLFHEDPFTVYISIVKHFRPFVPSASGISTT